MRGIQLPRVFQCRGDKAHCGSVETINRHHQKTQCNDEFLRARQRLCINELLHLHARRLYVGMLHFLLPYRHCLNTICLF